jgi:hypothetical protein
LMTQKDGVDGVDLLGEEALLEIARKSCLLMKGEAPEGRLEVVDPKLADVLVKILWNISKHWAVSHFLSTLIMANGRYRTKHPIPLRSRLKLRQKWRSKMRMMRNRHLSKLENRLSHYLG